MAILQKRVLGLAKDFVQKDTEVILRTLVWVECPVLWQFGKPFLDRLEASVEGIVSLAFFRDGALEHLVHGPLRIHRLQYDNLGM
jgi:hypothetical protein